MWLVQRILPFPQAPSMPVDFLPDDRQLPNQCWSGAKSNSTVRSPVWRGRPDLQFQSLANRNARPECSTVFVGQISTCDEDEEHETSSTDNVVNGQYVCGPLHLKFSASRYNYTLAEIYQRYQQTDHYYVIQGLTPDQKNASHISHQFPDITIVK